MTLVILAAGMGSRFGGLKQIQPVGPNGEFIIDYSIYDAIKAGFNKVVFIIRKENLDVFKETIGKRIEGKIDVEYAFQENDNLNIEIPKERVKPLGTAHAIYSLKGIVNEPFVVINADDFYGYEGIKQAHDFLTTNPSDYGLIGYLIGNTLTLNGSVKRGYCEAKEGYLTNIIESKVERIDDKILVKPLSGSKEFYALENDLVSMNLFCFNQDIIDYIGSNIEQYLSNNDILTCEYLISDVIFDRIHNNEINVKVVKTDSTWYGVTYKEDLPDLINSINKLIEEGKYPKSLY